MLPQQAIPTEMNSIANLHLNGMNSAFFDGHAKWVTPTMIWNSADLSGCRLIHAYPAPPEADGLAPEGRLSLAQEALLGWNNQSKTLFPQVPEGRLNDEQSPLSNILQETVPLHLQGP